MTIALVVSSLICGFGCGWAAGRRHRLAQTKREVVEQLYADRANALRAGLPTPALRPRIRSSIRSPRQATGPGPRQDS